jgi:FixJ family two-component response regulator
MLTTFEGDVEIHRAIEGGARGYILKSMPPAELIDVIRHVHAGRKRIPASIAAHLAEHLSDESLTSREIEVLRHVAAGNRNRNIADLLFEGSPQARDGETRSQRSNPGHHHRRAARHYSPLIGSPTEGFARLSPAAPWKQSPD